MDVRLPFRDRRDAGRQLAASLAEQLRGTADLLVLGLPRGGVPVASECARALGAPLDVFVVRKIGVPGHEELALGAIASGGVCVFNEDVARHAALDADVVEALVEREAEAVRAREAEYRSARPPLDVRGRTAILVDDGLATGATMGAAVRALRRMEPARIVIAVPAGSGAALATLAREVDAVVCLATPEPFLAVGQWYEDFSQTTDDEVRELLERTA